MTKTSNRKRVSPGLKEISIMAVFQTLQGISPRLASLMAYHLWFHPGRKGAKMTTGFMPEDTRSELLRINGKTVRYWHAGQGPSILLVHGWSGSGNQMADIGHALLKHGFRVVWMDAPAHGLSSGWQTNLFEISQAINAVQRQEGPFHTVLAHSFGVPCCLYAINNGLIAEKFIAIASPATATGLIDKFCRILKVNRRTKALLSQRIDVFLGDTSISEIAAETLALEIEQECLVIHDKHDRMIRSDEGRSLQKNLKHSSFVLTERLGHNKILSDAHTISLCIDFIQQDSIRKRPSLLMTS